MRWRSWTMVALLVAGCGHASVVSSSPPSTDKAADETANKVADESIDSEADATGSEASSKEQAEPAAGQATEPAAPSAEDNAKRLQELEATGPVEVSELRFSSTVAIPSDIRLHPVGDAAFISLTHELLLLEGNHLRRDEMFNQLTFDELTRFSLLSFAGSWPDDVWMVNSWWSDPGPSCGTAHRWQRYDSETARGRWQPMAQKYEGFTSLVIDGDHAIAINDAAGWGFMPAKQLVFGIDPSGGVRRTRGACADQKARLPLTPRVDSGELSVVGHDCRGEREEKDRSVVVNSWRGNLSPLPRRTLVNDEVWVDALLFRDGEHLLGLAEQKDGWKLALLDSLTPELIGELPADAIPVAAPGTDELWLLFAEHLLFRTHDAWMAIPLSKELANTTGGGSRYDEVWRRGPKDIWLKLNDRHHSLSHTGPISLGEGIDTLDTDEEIRAYEERRERAKQTPAACPEGWFVELYKLNPHTLEANIDPATDLMSRREVLNKLRAVVKRFPSAQPVEHDCCGESCVGVTVSKKVTASKILEMLRRPTSDNDTTWFNYSMSLFCGLPPWLSPLKL